MSATSVDQRPKGQGNKGAVKPVSEENSFSTKRFDSSKRCCK
ncbi:YTHDF3 isoform 8 [Pan troglodytes]|uniref:YTH N6-methyladenosine RNA binding protein F3 n=3 Tax=Hominidae TaxID=9604 RepID=A0A087X0C3_HUMAN|nr:YTHDF3 isoform 8 [Pan troglodytes]PNJ47707.1 YTHDF3 isoform 8 [Pongo abelii]